MLGCALQCPRCKRARGRERLAAKDRTPACNCRVAMDRGGEALLPALRPVMRPVTSPEFHDMKFFVCLLAAALSLPAARAQDSTPTFKLGALQISQPWSRATPKGASVAGAYLKITNTGTAPDRLLGGSSPIAGRFEIHEMSMDNGVMRMRQIKDGLVIKPGESVEFKPGSYHVMLLDLKQRLQKGDRLKGTLTFEQAGSIEIEYSVVGVGETLGAGAAAPSGRGMSH